MHAEGSEPITVVVVDDHALFRSGLRALLEERGIHVIGEAPSGQSGIALVDRRQPQVVVMDLNMPGMSGAEATRRISAASPTTRVLVLTVSAIEEDVLDAIEAGALGYLLKDAPPDEIVRGIEAAAEGQSALSPSVAQQFIARARRLGAREHAKDLRRALSPRELQVLRLMAEGKHNAEIAAELFISTTTVKNHVSAVMSKFGVSNRVQAAIKAVRNGLI